MKYEIARKCEFLVKDAPMIARKMHKNALPAVNHFLAYQYAVAVEPLLDFAYPERNAKAESLLYLKMVTHTAKHLLHKYKRHPEGIYKYSAWGVEVFNMGAGKNFTYVEFPRMEDLFSLKREIMSRTPIKVKNPDLDKALDSLNGGVLSEYTTYTMMEFHKDFELVHSFWEVMINFMIAERNKAQTTVKEGNNTVVDNE